MQALDIDVQDEYAKIAAFFDEAEQLLRWPDDVLYGLEASTSQWSPAQHLHHILISDGMMLKGIQVIRRGGGPVTEAGEPNKVGRVLLQRERFPRGRAQAPDRVLPDDRPDRDTLTSSLARSRAKLADLEAILPSLDEHAGRLPHPFFGDLNAAEWLRSVRVHSEHHLGIIREIADSRTSG